MATTVTSKGQVTIPKKVRDFLGIEAGSSVDFEVTDAGVMLRPRRTRPHRQSRFAKLRGTATVKMGTEEIMALTRGRKGRNR